MSALYRSLPKVDVLLEQPSLKDLPRHLVVHHARLELAALREGIRSGEVQEVGDVAAAVRGRIDYQLALERVSVINATGILVHTNLGRAPWAPLARSAATRAMGYTNLEMDLATGQRGGRLSGIAEHLRFLTGAEDAIAVNNGAAALLLAVTAVAQNREVVVSRGELVEIGGSFRIPDVIATGGARLAAVGTTNRTHLDDFSRAIGPGTAALLRVHPSNFRVVGFTACPSREELAALARERNVLAMEDLGSGSIHGRPGEPAVREVVASGMDLVTFSADKLLGGPQAGLIVGTRDAVSRLRSHPMYRAMRLDKVVLAALEATLALHVSGTGTEVDRMLDESLEAVEQRARMVGAHLEARGVPCTVAAGEAFTGGGALPGKRLPSWVVALNVASPEALAKRLRTGSPAIVGRVHQGQLRLDLRTVHPSETEALVERVASAIEVG